MAADLPPDQIPPYEEWLADSGLDDNATTRDDYARQYFSVDLPPVGDALLEEQPTDGPLDGDPTDGPLGSGETPVDAGTLADDATAEALANADAVIADLNAIIDAAVTEATTPAVTALSTLAGNVANAVQAATSDADALLGDLDQTTAVALAEATIQAIQAAEDVLPPDVTTATAGPGLFSSDIAAPTFTDPAPPGIDPNKWAAGLVTCAEWRAAVSAWIASNLLNTAVGEPLGTVFSTPFGPVEFNFTGEDDSQKQTFPYFGGASFLISNTDPTDPQNGHIAYPKVTYPDGMNTSSCGGGGSGNGGGSGQGQKGCYSFEQWLAAIGQAVLPNTSVDEIGVLVGRYSQYRDTCARGPDTQAGGSCDEPLYVTLCAATTTSTTTTGQGGLDTDPAEKLANGDPLPPGQCSAQITVPTHEPIAGDWTAPLSTSLGLTDKEGKLRAGPGVEELPFYLRWSVYGLQKVVVSYVNAFGAAAGAVSGASLCTGPRYLTAQFSRAILGILSIFFRGAFSKSERAYEQVQDAECPQEFPSPAEANTAYLAATITKDQWTCYQQIGNVRPAEAEPILDALRDRPGTFQCIDLWRRGMIDRDTLNTRLRALGVTHQSERDELVALSYYVPTVSDLIPWMVKDVFNPQIVQQFGLDDQFDVSFGPQAQEWATANGISREIMQAAWRAHWHLPSPTQLAEFWHRFRHDGRHGTPAEFRQRIKDALRQADWLPTWIDDYIDAQDRILTRVDARRAFEVGAIDRQTLWLTYTKQGYSDVDAEALTRFNETTIARKFVGHWANKAYQAGTLSQEEATHWMELDGASIAAVGYALQIAAAKRDAARRATCIKAARRRFLQGEIDDLELANQIQLLTGDADVTRDLVEATKCDRHNRSKLPAVNQICGWLSNGAIGAAEAFERLQRLGYDDEDAALLLRDCQLRIGLSINKAQAKQIKEAAARKKALERERLAALKETRDNRVRMARLRDQKAATSKRRSDVLVKAASQLALGLHLSVEDTFPVVNDYYQGSIRNTIQLPDDILLALANVAARATSKDLADYVEQVDAALAGLPAAVALPDATEATTILAEPWPPLSL